MRKAGPQGSSSKADVVPGAQAVDLDQQGQEARDAGVSDVCRLLAAPEDLARLQQLRAEVSSKLASSRSTLSSTTAAQVDAARYGLQLLDKSHRHIAKLRLCIDRIDELCGECSTLVENHDKIRALSHAHRNVQQVLEELGDIIDLPMRAAAVEELMNAGDGGMVAAFEGLSVLEGTANNIKEAWRRNAKKSSDLGELADYLTQVGEAMTSFERRLWSLARDYHTLAQRQPRRLVDVARVVEMQQQMDAHYASTKATYVRPRHYRERLLLEMEAAVAQRFAPLLALCAHHGQPNTKVKYDQDGNRVLSEARDYLGALTDVERCDPLGHRLPGATDAELAVMQIREEDMFDEDMWLETLLGGFGALEAELAEAYDYVSPCFPPHYNIFDIIFQMYHVQFAQAMDTVGQVSQALSTAGQLRLMQWVCGYQQTLRGLGVQEELVRLPVAPMSLDSAPGFALLINSYTDRMEATMTAWYRAILAQDVAGQPQQMTDGTLRTPGVVDFFRMLNEQVSVLEEISTGEVLLAAASRSLKLMQDFVAAQQELLKPGGVSALLAAAAAAAAGPAGVSGSSSSSGTKLAAATAAAAAAGGKAAGGVAELSFEMVASFLNNSVDCYNQSLEFTDHVQSLLDEGLSSQLDVSVLEEISTGEVLLAAASRSLKLMQDFVAAQQELLKPGGVSALLAAAAAAAAGPAGVSGSSSSSGTKLAAATAAAAAAGGKAAGGVAELSFEMVASFLNNSVDCYNQSLEFTDHVQSLLDEGLSSQLDVEDTCRAFLELAKTWVLLLLLLLYADAGMGAAPGGADVRGHRYGDVVSALPLNCICTTMHADIVWLAKAWGQRLVEMMYADAGIVEQWRRMYSSADWLNGKTCATLLATIGDYFQDVTTFVEPGFCRRVCEGVLEEHVRRASSAAVAALDRGAVAAVAAMDSGAAAAAAAAGGGGGADADDLVLGRLVQDERDVQLFFEPFVPRDRLMHRVTQLAGLLPLH
uniref:Exocyst complex component Sec6 n=1 Tax=Tetradesmus obliquus TaxID=3088 RepID=A0A383WAU5_TETOB|eukprot:jgi/Sobl393_1/3542/SZX74363.1